MDFEAAIIEHCSPTLAGLKAGNMFRIKATKDELEKELKRFKEIFKGSDICVEVLKYCEKTSSYLMYVYRENQLKKIFSDEAVNSFMKQHNYKKTNNHTYYISRLSEKMRSEAGFPHEVGIFLGYPLCDVKGFIKFGGKNSTCQGFWKSYDKPEVAEKRFEQIRKCNKIYKNLFLKGKSINQLMVQGY